MANVAAFRQALIRCGLDNEAANMVVVHGFTDTTVFSTISHSILDTMFESLRRTDIKIYEAEATAAVAAGNQPAAHQPKFPFAAQGNVHGFLLWCQQRRRLNRGIDAGSFSAQMVVDYATMYSAGKEEPLQDLVSKPGKFKSTTVWHEWNEKLVLYLESLTSINQQAPLSYVIREDPNPPAANYDFASDIERAHLSTPHTGIQFTKDKASIYHILREATMNEACDTVINAFSKSRDGRAAYLALKLHAEGGADGSIIIAQCYKELDDLRYRGELPTFGVRDLHSRMRKAFARLADQGVELPEHEKIRRLKQVYSENPHIKVAAAISLVDADATKHDTFEHASDFLQQQMLQISWPTKKGTSRSISATGSEQTVSDGKPRLEVKNYSPQEFSKFSPAQKAQLKADRQEKKKESGSDNKQSRKTKRQIKSLKEQNKKLKAQLEGKGDEGGNTDDSNQGGSAGAAIAGGQRS